jgi:hypothetical protein
MRLTPLGNWATVSPPPRLYHYTSFAGLLGILKEKALWASSVHHLSDALEVSFALEQFNKVAIGRELGNPLGLEQYFVIGLRNVLNDLQGPIQRVGKDMNLIYTYVSSFCEEGDRLSQWRAYSPPGGGVCLGFDAQKLAQVAQRSDFELIKCLYDETTQGERIRDFVSKLLGSVEADLKASHQTPESNPILRALSGDYTAIWPYHQEIIRCAATLKHEAFNEEHEWRLVSRGAPIAGALGCRFRETPNTIVPYRSIPLSFEGEPLPLEEIIIGPGPLKRLTQVSVWNMLLQESLLRECKVVTSKIEYRPMH